LFAIAAENSFDEKKVPRKEKIPTASAKPPTSPM